MGDDVSLHLVRAAADGQATGEPRVCAQEAVHRREATAARGDNGLFTAKGRETVVHAPRDLIAGDLDHGGFFVRNLSLRL